MPINTLGCPHCGAQTDVPVQRDKQVTEIKKDRSILDAFLVFQGTDVKTVECPDGHEFCIYQE